jgi:hypothetical protein
LPRSVRIGVWNVIPLFSEDKRKVFSQPRCVSRSDKVSNTPDGTGVGYDCPRDRKACAVQYYFDITCLGEKAWFTPKEFERNLHEFEERRKATSQLGEVV